MAEYIERDEALNAIERSYWTEGAYERVERLPAADVVEVKRGRWERYSDDKFIGYDADGKLKYRKVYKYECSKCLRETAVKSDFCPNCGCLMKGD